MARQVINTITTISAVLLAVTIVMFILGYNFSPWEHAISLSPTFHVGVRNRGLDSRLVFFNDREYGPYQGSVIELVDENGKTYPPLKSKKSWGDSWGVYYRYFEWPDGSVLWTLMVSLWYPIALFAVLPIAWLLRRSFRGSAGMGNQ